MRKDETSEIRRVLDVDVAVTCGKVSTTFEMETGSTEGWGLLC